MGRGPIILRNYIRKYGRIEASYTDDLGRRLDALIDAPTLCIIQRYLASDNNQSSSFILVDSPSTVHWVMFSST